MGLFIEVRVKPEASRDRAVAARLAEVCPVNIYAQSESGEVAIVEDNVDECTLCELCLKVGPSGAVEVRKLYDGARLLVAG
jgi:NAD-dependent dihydropyrimidine dehydrogenase PreA subunit